MDIKFLNIWKNTMKNYLKKFPIRTRWKLSLGLTTLFLAGNLALRANKPSIDMPTLERISESPRITIAEYKDRKEYYFRFFNIKSENDTLDVAVYNGNKVTYYITYSSRSASFESENPKVLS